MEFGKIKQRLEQVTKQKWGRGKTSFCFGRQIFHRQIFGRT